MSQTAKNINVAGLKQLLSELNARPQAPIGDHVSDDELVWYVSASLTGAHRNQVVQHLHSCVHCARLAEAMFVADEQRTEQTVAKTAASTATALPITLAEGIRQYLSGWISFDWAGVRYCQNALAQPVLHSGEKPNLPDALPVAVKALDCVKDSLSVRLSWLREAPVEPPRVAVEFGTAGDFATVWHNWQRVAGATQVLEIKGMGRERTLLEAARNEGRPLLAVRWEAEADCLYLQLLPNV
jgi:hypothetical protein